MRYIDSGSRQPNQALGTWLSDLDHDRNTSAELRCQSGFFGADGISFLVPILRVLEEIGGLVRIVVGSNDGTTARADIEALLEVVGPCRPELGIAVVSYDNAFFHPKTLHLTRADGSAAAYVGSANFTRSGVTSLHVEAGIILDTLEGDSPTVLAEIAAAVDRWFAGGEPGCYPVTEAADLDHLQEIGILNVPKPRSPRGAGTNSAGKEISGARLAPLIGAPPLPAYAAKPIIDAPLPSGGDEGEISQPGAGSVEPATWSKRLSASDAQRKQSGNQRGSITLVRGDYEINTQTYFRESFFADATWAPETTRTGQDLEAAIIPFRVNLLGQDLGVMSISVTYAPNREAKEGNYTSLLHLGPLSDHFVQEDMTGRTLTLQRSADGSFALEISD